MSSPVKVYAGDVLCCELKTDKDKEAFVNGKLIPALKNIPHGWALEYKYLLHFIHEADGKTIGINYNFFKDGENFVFDKLVDDLDEFIYGLNPMELIIKC